MKRALAASVASSVALLAMAVVLPTPSSAQRSDMRSALRTSGAPIRGFTPAVQDPRLAAALANSRPAGERGFRFTPASNMADSNRQVRVAVRVRPGLVPRTAERVQGAQVAAPVQPTPAQPTVAASSYNLGTSIGWRRFAVTGDVERSDGGAVPSSRESARVGVDYRASRRLTGRVEVGAERAEGVQRIVGDDRAYSVDVGGSYSIARGIDVTGGVRYRTTRDRLEPLARDERRDSQAVYIGTAFRF